MKKKGFDISTYNFFYLFFNIIWTPIHAYYFPYDGAGRLILLLSIIAIICNLNTIITRRDIFGSKAFVCWTLLTLFSFVNVVNKGIISEQGVLSFVTFNFVSPYAFFTIVIVEFARNRGKALKVLFWAFITYVVIGATHSSASQSDRILSEELGNSVPLMCMGAMFMVNILQAQKQLKGGWKTYVGVLLFLFIVIVLAGTRKALGGFVILMAGMILQHVQRLSFKTVLMLMVSCIAAFFVLQFILDNTFIGERLSESSDKYDVPLVGNEVINSFLMSLLGDRAIMYLMGVELFLQYPITGIGLCHFISVTQYEFRLHTEYMVQLCENGIIGISLLLVFYIILWRKLMNKRKEGKKVTIYISGLLTILFLNLTAWTYNLSVAMVIYACIISLVYSEDNSTPNNSFSYC